jgi:pimeloyl-ACP methyl ester carboxylesterase
METPVSDSEKKANVNDYYISPSGPYGVGHRQTVLEEGTKPIVSIFYPIDKTDYDTYKHDETRNSPFYLDGIKDLEGIKEGLGADTPNSDKENLAYRLHVLNDAELHQDFSEPKEQLTPIIMSHGLMSNRTTQAALIYHLVSYGCIVYSLNHTDGSATYFKNYQVDPPVEVICNSHLRHIPEDSNPVKHFGIKVDERMKDIDVLLKFIKQEAEQYSIDLNKLVATGHSLGGITAIETSLKFPDEIKL